ncbi:MAG TPA: YdcH family protein [Bryobacteraceae bacterium]|nr:YdcH family protein [Bryobacteraceae bacterium]
MAAHKGESTLMENTQEDLKAHLMRTDEEFRRLAEKHQQYHQLLEALEAKPHLLPEDEIEEHRLKKLKLNIKDQMNQIMSRYKAQQVA